NNLFDLIMKNEVKPGDKLLPAESMAKKFKISVASTREAVQSLATMGLVDIIHGRGIFLTEGRPIIEELLEARMAIEPFTVAMAAERIDEEGLVRMESVLDEMDRCLAEGIRDTFNENDCEFHLLISKAAGNRFLFKVLSNTRELLRYQVFAVNAIPSLLRASAIRHREIFEAIRNHDPEAARRVMEQHITEAVRFWKRDGGLSVVAAEGQGGRLSRS
ncbi:MAG: FadR family transcriptional regulator, partial [Syntrophorhabdaceae bacterium]|nr:FadR family transcriptional regulator [Syntrophorhabdaceae bacterium]